MSETTTTQAAPLTVRVIRERGDDASDLRGLYVRALRLGVEPQDLLDLAEECGHRAVLRPGEVEGCERTWSIREDGCEFAEHRAETGREALAMVDPEDGSYEQRNGPVAGTYYASCAVTGEQETRDWVLDQTEPACETRDDEHVWSSDIRLVGGIESNPGVWGHGGGVTSLAVCLRCGCRRTHDSWWQRPDNGEVARETVTSYADSQGDHCDIGGSQIDGSEDGYCIAEIDDEDGWTYYVVSGPRVASRLFDDEAEASAWAREEHPALVSSGRRM